MAEPQHQEAADAADPDGYAEFRAPGATQRDIAFNRLPDNPESLLHETLYPDDAYSGTTYWADLPLRQRTKFVNHQSNKEAGREFGIVLDMAKKDPLAPIGAYMSNFVVTGVGFFTEGYVLFSVGNILPLFESVWPQCFKRYEVCNMVWVDSANYLEIVGIIVGQVVVGIIGDWIGRRWGLIQDAAILLLGSLMLTGMWGTSLYGWTVMYAISLLVFGFGVGGEYPMTSITAMEGVRGQGSTKADRLHRGRSVLLAFLMQGWGQLINQAVLIIVMLIFHHSGDPPWGNASTQETFRITFFIAALFIAYFLYLRVYKLKNVDHSLRASRSRSNVTGYDMKSLRLTFSHYWHRLLATALCWFCNDFPFYGNQIFRSLLIQLITTNSNDIMKYWLYNLISVGCELVGYYLAAFLIDHKFYGRKRMQAVGFIMSFILFIIAAVANPILHTAPGTPGAQAFIFIYSFSSFW
jgi:MFS family permease